MAKLLILKVLSEDGKGSYKNIIDAIKYATTWTGPKGEKVRIISMSLGGGSDVSKLHDAIKNAVNKDILVVCASGNDGDNNSNTDEYNYPAAYPEAVSVGAVKLDKKMANFSNTNKNVDLVAPGVNILSTYLKGSYAKLNGTSMATPHVASAAALIINHSEAEFRRKLSETEIYAQLIKKTTSLGYDKRSEGNGIIDLSKL